MVHEIIEADITLVDLRHRAVEVLLAVTAGAYQTTLLTYMVQRDLFPSVMKVRSVSLTCNTCSGDIPAY